MPRFQFSLRDLLWLVLVVAGFLGGMAIQRRLDEPKRWPYSAGWDQEGNECFTEALTFRDGTTWLRSWKVPKPDVPDVR